MHFGMASTQDSLVYFESVLVAFSAITQSIVMEKKSKVGEETEGDDRTLLGIMSCMF